MPPAFSIRTIQQCSIPSVCASRALFKERGRKVSLLLLQRKKMFDVRMVSHESKWKIKLCNEEFLKARENPFKGIQFKGKAPWLFLPNKLFLTTRSIYTHPNPWSLPLTSRKDNSTKCLREYLFLNNIFNICKNQSPGAYCTTEILQKSCLSYQNTWKGSLDHSSHQLEQGQKQYEMPASKCIWTPW